MRELLTGLSAWLRRGLQRYWPAPAPAFALPPAAAPVVEVYYPLPAPDELATEELEAAPTWESEPPAPAPLRYHAPLRRADAPRSAFDQVPLTPGAYARRHSSRPMASWAIDLSVSVGTPVYALDDGEIVRVSDVDDIYNGVGLWLRPASGPATQAAYIHLRDRLCEVGALVRRGDLIGYTGSTGASSGPHLHWEIAPALDPLDPSLVDWVGAGWTA